MAVRDPGAGAPIEADVYASDFPAVPRSVGAARTAVAELAQRHGASNGRLDDIRLAVSEATTNVVMHAYRADAAPGRFRIRAEVAGQKLKVVVEDDGCGPDAPALSPGLGMGLRLMGQICERMQMLGRDAGGTTVRLCFVLGA